MGGGGFETRGGACFGFPTKKKWFPGGREDRKMPVIKSSQKNEVSLEEKSRNKILKNSIYIVIPNMGITTPLFIEWHKGSFFCLSAPLLCLNTFFSPSSPTPPPQILPPPIQEGLWVGSTLTSSGDDHKTKTHAKKSLNWLAFVLPTPYLKVSRRPCSESNFSLRTKWGSDDRSCRGNFFAYFVDFFCGNAVHGHIWHSRQKM